MPVIVIAMLVALAWSVQAGWFYQTGSQWFETCWSAKSSKDEPTTFAESFARKQCQPVADRAIYGAGFIYSGMAERAVTPELQAIQRACPSQWSDVAWAGAHFTVLKMLEDNGGPDFIDRFLPAERTVARVFLKRWPDCPRVREENGFPKIVKQPDGEWGFATPCRPCEAERLPRDRK
jgi:hypothetical protein